MQSSARRETLPAAWRGSVSAIVEYWILTPLRRHIKRKLRASDLHLTIDRTPALKKADFVVLAAVRNEAPRIPFFLSYYRKLGFEHFIFIDNESTDGLSDLVRHDEDVTLYTARGSYKASRHGVDWINEVLSRHAHGKWILNVDADEFLIYPRSDFERISALASRLISARRRALPTMMVDMYSPLPVAQNICRPGENPLDICPFFDAAGYIETIETPLSVKHIRGGPRARLFFSTPAAAPLLNKTPLVLWRRHYAFCNSTHELWPPGLGGQGFAERTGMGGALLHFKFLADLLPKVSEENVRQQHTTEYQRYSAGVEASVDDAFMTDGSTRFTSWKSLEASGLMFDVLDQSAAPAAD